MKTLFYGQLDLTKLGEVIRKMPALQKQAQFKDGQHKLVYASILETDKPDKFGNTLTLVIDCKKEERVEGVNCFVGNFKPSTRKEEKPAEQHAETWDTPIVEKLFDKDDLPF